MAVKAKGIYIVAAKRTPFVKYGGGLRDMPAGQMFAAAAKSAFLEARLEPQHVDTTVIGNVHFLSQCDGGKTARYCGIYSGVPLETPAFGVNKACGSGLQAIINGAQDIMTGLAKVSLTGGTENMSSLPYLVRDVRFGTSLGQQYEVQDHIAKVGLDSYCGLTATQIAEQTAAKYSVSRDQADEFALHSRRKWKKASEAGIFKSEIAHVTVSVKDQDIVIDQDEESHQELTAGELSRSPGAVVTPGNSSSPADGAATVILAIEEFLNQHEVTPLAKLTAWSCRGVHPLEAGEGAVMAMKHLLTDINLTVENIDLFEINETFSAQTIACISALRLDESRVNVSGGTLALGNPVGASGARLVVHMVHQLRKLGLQRGICATSCGGGQGIAVMIEAV